MKNMSKKKLTIIAAITILFVGIVVGVLMSVLPGVKYNKAQAALSKCKYKEAVIAFAALGNYRDSEQKVKEIATAVPDLREELPNISVYAASVGSYTKFAGDEWIVLAKEDGRALLLSRNTVGEMPYNNEFCYTTWEECSLRAWLNGEYLETEFSERERELIKKVTVVNSNNEEYGTSGGNDTSDMVFLLSIEEVNQLVVSEEKRMATNPEGEQVWWWLRTPGYNSSIATDVHCDGTIYDYGFDITTACGTVRPAIWVDVSGL